MISLVRRVLRRQDALNLKLRKAVTQRKTRLVATLLDRGASPTWADDGLAEMNALLLACHYGDVDILTLILDSFFTAPHVLGAWGRHMYCIVIRNGHYRAFRLLVDRKTPMESHDVTRSKLPAPAFVAAEMGRTRMLRYLVKVNPLDLAGYSFNGHSLLSIASKNGHYECVEALLSQVVASDETLDFALQIARQQRQAHVLVLLTSCLPQYVSNSEPVIYQPTMDLPVKQRNGSNGSQSSSSGGGRRSSSVSKPRRSSQSHGHYNRGSLAETELLSDYGEDDEEYEDRGSTSSFDHHYQQYRRSSASWLYPKDKDIHVYHPYLAADEEEEEEKQGEGEGAQVYERYIRALDEKSGHQEWSSTPPGSSSSSKQHTSATKNIKTKTWYYHNEVILPYENDGSSETKETTTSQLPPPLPPRSAKPQLPPASTDASAQVASLFVSPAITQISRKLITIRSKSLSTSHHRASM